MNKLQQAVWRTIYEPMVIALYFLLVGLVCIQTMKFFSHWVILVMFFVVALVGADVIEKRFFKSKEKP